MTTPQKTRRKPGRPKLTNPRTPLNTAVSARTHDELRSLAENTGMALNRLVEVAIHALWVNNPSNYICQPSREVKFKDENN